MLLLAFAAVFVPPASAQGITTYAVDGATGGTFPAAINAEGTVAGTYFDANGNHGYLRGPDGTITTFDDPSQDRYQACSLCLQMPTSTLVWSMNDAAVVVGTYSKPIGSPLGVSFSEWGFMPDASGNFTDIAPPGIAPSLVTSIQPQISINDVGEIAGSYCVSRVCTGFVRDSSGNYTVFDIAAATEGINVASINASGTVGGFYDDSSGIGHGFVRDPSGNISTFDAPAGLNITVYGMNDLGQLIGSYGTITVGPGKPPTFTENFFGFVTQGATITQALQVNEDTVPQSINDSGAVVGWACSSSGAGCDGFEWNPPSTTTNTVTDPGYFTEATSINAVGAISGVAFDNSFLRNGFVATPGAAVGPPISGTSCDGTYNGTFIGDITVTDGQSCTFTSGTIKGKVHVKGKGKLFFGDVSLKGLMSSSCNILAGSCPTIRLFKSSVSGSVTVDGGIVSFTDTNVDGNITVDSNSSLPTIVSANSDPTVINGNLQITNLSAASSVSICGYTVNGDVQVLDNSGRVLIGTASSSCQGNVINGNLQVQQNSAPTGITGNQVNGSMQDQNNTAETEVFGNTVTGNLQCQNDSLIAGGGNVAPSKQGECSAF